MSKPDRNDWFETNRDSWNERVAPHLTSEMYDMEGFLAGKSSLQSIELGLLPDVKNRTLLHLQCHFGQDTLSWQRLGAQATGVDISDKAVAKARELADQLDLESKFLCANVLDVGSMVDQPFDIVFTSYGTITWLPDLDDWAKVVDECLKPGGEFVIVEFHPMMWSLDDEFKSLGYDYFNRQAHQHEESGTYADRDAEIDLTYYWWNHPLSEVSKALLGRGLELRQFDEYDYSCYDCLPGLERIEDRKYRFAHLGDSIPYMYSMKWRKNAIGSETVR